MIVPSFKARHLEKQGYNYYLTFMLSMYLLGFMEVLFFMEPKRNLAKANCTSLIDPLLCYQLLLLPFYFIIFLRL